MKNLNEYTDKELEKELARRNEMRLRGLCSYCAAPLEGVRSRNPIDFSPTPCRFHEIWVGEKPGKVLSRQVVVRRKV